MPLYHLNILLQLLHLSLHPLLPCLLGGSVSNHTQTLVLMVQVLPVGLQSPQQNLPILTHSHRHYTHSLSHSPLLPRDLVHLPSTDALFDIVIILHLSCLRLLPPSFKIPRDLTILLCGRRRYVLYTTHSHTFLCVYLGTRPELSKSNLSPPAVSTYLAAGLQGTVYTIHYVLMSFHVNISYIPAIMLLTALVLM